MPRPRIPLRLLVGDAPPALPGATQLDPGPRSRPSGERVVARRGDSLVFLEASEIWAFQGTGDRTVVHCPHGKLELQVGLDEIEQTFCRPLVRVHADWLVDLSRVRALERDSGPPTLFVGESLAGDAGVRVPIGRDRLQAVQDALISGSTGLRTMRRGVGPGGQDA